MTRLTDTNMGAAWATIAAVLSSRKTDHRHLAGGGPGLRNRPWILPAVLAIFSFLTFAVWAVSSPVGSSPDDDFHMASIWCADGVHSDGSCVKVGDTKGGSVEKMVPLEFVDRPCWAFTPASAGCSEPHAHGLMAGRANAGLYPPVYYRAMNLFSSSDITASVIAMRLINALIAVVFVSAAVALTRGTIRRAVILTWMLGIVPLGLFIIPSVNPSSWAIVGLGTFWAFLLAFLIGEGGRVRIANAAMAVLSFGLAVSAREDAPVFGALIAGACLVIAVARRDKAVFKLLALPVGLGLAGSLLFLAGSATSVASAGVVSDGMPGQVLQDDQRVALLVHNLVRSPELVMGSFGTRWSNDTDQPWSIYWGLGWLDTPIPPEVPILVVACLAVVVGVSLRNATRWRLVALVPLVVGLLLVPVYLLQQSGQVIGVNIQARYLLPLLLATIGICLAGVINRPDAAPWRGTRAQFVLIGIAAAVANFYALQANIVRYVSGLSFAPLDPNSRLEWWWHGAWVSPRTLLLMGVVLGAVAWISAGLLALRSQDQIPRSVSAPAESGPV